MVSPWSKAPRQNAIFFNIIGIYIYVGVCVKLLWEGRKRLLHVFNEFTAVCIERGKA